MHTMTLYSDPNNAQSHRVRIVLGEKDLVFKIEEVLSGQNNEDLIALNPNKNKLIRCSKASCIIEVR